MIKSTDMKKTLLLLTALCFIIGAQAQKTFKLSSPDGKLATTITVGDALTYDITLNGQQILAPSALSMKLTTGEQWGVKPRLASNKKGSINRSIPSPFYRDASLQEQANTLTLNFKGNYSVEFRAYNDGIAYRFASTKKGEYFIESEGVNYAFPQDFKATVPYVNAGKDGDWASQFANSFENVYSEGKISELNQQHLAFLPLIVDAGVAKVCISEANLENYPGLYLRSDGKKLVGMNAPYPKRMEQGGHNQLEMLVKEGENFIAKMNGSATFPWRIAIVADDKGLAASTLNYQLAEPSRVADTSWIKPGKVAWDWWNDWNISGVPFRAGINNDTYKFYIDFASKYGIEYVILDEGWAVNLKADLMQVIPEIDLQELVNYGKARNVGIVLWAGYYAFARDMENVVKYFADMGVKGFKVDFMNRDDQIMTNFVYKAADLCAKYHMFVDFHGMFKPAGLNRTYPNVLNCEGVNGLEQLKWSPNSHNMVKYDTQIPFLRQVAGPMDYTQGAMINATRRNYHPSNSEPMSQGTRSHQLALYMIFDSPFNMLCDSPTNYIREAESTEFIANVPTVWDETRILDGKLGEYIITARRSGNTWYIGGITDWTPRDLTVDLSFLSGSYKADLFKDGVNADRKASDYVHEQSTFNGGKLNIHLAPGGGFALKLTK